MIVKVTASMGSVRGVKRSLLLVKLENLHSADAWLDLVPPPLILE